MNKETEAGIWVLGIIGMFFVSMITADYNLDDIPFTLFFGIIIVMFVMIIRLWFEIFRGKSPQFICNVGDGHFSINPTKDIFNIPACEGKYDEQTAYFPMAKMVCAGGINYWEFSTRGGPEQPTFFTISKYQRYHEQENIVNSTIFTEYEFDELPPHFQIFMRTLRPERLKFDKKLNKIIAKGPIFYGVTSNMDGSATPENLQNEILEKAKNKHHSITHENMIKIYDELRRQKSMKKQPIFIGTEVKDLQKED